MLKARSVSALLLLATALSSSAAASPRAAPVQVAFLQGEQVVYVDRAGSSLQQAMTSLLAGPTKSEEHARSRRRSRAARPSGP